VSSSKTAVIGLLALVGAELIYRQGLTPIKTLGEAASGKLVLIGAATVNDTAEKSKTSGKK
jgi:hypothetical protein